MNQKNDKKHTKNRKNAPKYSTTRIKKTNIKQEAEPSLLEQNGEIIYGKHAVLELLKQSKQVNKILYQKNSNNKAISDIINIVKQQGILFQEVPKAKLDELTQQANHQGIVATIPPFEYQPLEACFELAQARQEEPVLLILDGIEDPHNLGSILRTADATGVHGVIIPKRRAATLTGVVAKTATGALEHVPVVRVTNLVQTIEQLQARGVWVFATDMQGQDMRQWNSQGAIAIVIGNEGQGVSQLIKQKVDGTITIPMGGHVQSLNASVAAGVLMYEVARHRLPLA